MSIEDKLECAEEELQMLLDEQRVHATRLAVLLQTAYEDVGDSEWLQDMAEIVMIWGGFPETDCALCCQTPDLCSCEV